MKMRELSAAALQARNRVAAVLSLCALGATLMACGGSDQPAESTSSTSLVTVSGPDGAAVSLSPLQRQAHQQATIRVARDSSGAPQLDSRLTPLSSIYQYSPLGWIDKEIELRVPFQAGAGKPQLMVSQPGGRWMEVADARLDGAFMVGRVLQLGYAIVVTSSERSRLGDRVSALAASVHAMSGGTANPSFSVAIGANTSPQIPAPIGGNWPKVLTPTNLALEVRYDLPSCSTSPVVEVIGMTWEGDLQNIRYVNLGRRDLPGVNGVTVYQMPLTIAENGNWVFSANTFCKELGHSEVTYAKIAYSSTFAVEIGGVTPAPLPSIVTHPVDQAVVSGTAVTFNVLAQGDALAYEWQRSNDGGASYASIASAASTSYSLTTGLGDSNALFRVRVTNTGGSVISTPALLTVTPVLVGPVITNDPVNQAVVEGDSASFTVTGTGQPSPAIQWQQRGSGATSPEAGWTDISGATGNSYTVGSVTLAQSGLQFRALLRNAAGTSPSSPATLSVSVRQIAPSITTAPVAADVVAGQLALFSLTASGTSPLSYQWYRNGQAIVGANGSEIVIPATQADIGSSIQISVRVSNVAGEATTQPVLMRVTLDGTSIPASSGGTVAGPAGTTLTVPPDALAGDTTISLTSVAVDPQDLPLAVQAVSDAVVIQPSTLSLLQPARLLMPAPADLPAGMTFAVLRLESLEDDGAPSGLRVATGTNLRRAAAQGLTTVPPRKSIQRLIMPTSLACENPQNTNADGMFEKLVSLGGRYQAVVTSLTNCSSISPRIDTPEVPSTTDQKCTTESDFVPMVDGASENQERALLSRHVDCRSGFSSEEEIYVDLIESNGTFRYADPTRDANATVVGDSIGRVRLHTKMSTFGTYSQLSKRVSMTIRAVGFVPNSTYRGPNRNPNLLVRPVFSCGTAYEVSNYWPDCVASGQPISVPLNGTTEATGEFSIAFNWAAPQAPQKDVLTFQLFFHRFEFAPQGASFVHTGSGEASYFSPGLDAYGILVRCDRFVAHPQTRGCVFPQAAAVLTQKLLGGGVDENSAHIVEAQGRGAPGRFAMKAGFRAIADDSVRGGSYELRRTQFQRMRDANRAASCDRSNSVINLAPRASASCPNGRAGGCQCDEYPFASTYEGAWSVLADLPVQEVPVTASAKFILGPQNEKAGTDLGLFYHRQRVIDTSTPTGQTGTLQDPTVEFNRDYGGDPFWVRITP